MAMDPLLDEQIAYYRAIASEYDTHSIDAPGQPEVLAAFDRFDIGGDVLELTCGQGIWTERLAGSADSMTVVEAAPEMIDIAKKRLGDEPVTFIEADLFTWQPERRWDSVFFGFWLSHVPDERLDAFWTMVADCLVPGGQAFFVDDNHRTEAELIEGPESSVVERRLHDGTAFRAVKVPYTASGLTERLGDLGWDVAADEAGPFYWGTATRS